jgi:lysophospholipase L1-like esterase
VGLFRAGSVARASLAIGLLLATSSSPLATSLPFAHASSAPSSTESPTAGLSYVALGDSYAAGFGNSPGTGKPVAACGQAVSNYPHQIATALSLKLVDESCAGAVAANVVSAGQVLGKRTVPPQSQALGPDTRVVTITIGGNDLGFFDTMSSCLAVTPKGPLLTTGKANCRANLVTGGVDSLAKRITDVVSTRLTKTFTAIKADAPNAKVFVVGYPAIMPDAANTPPTGCFTGSFSGTISAMNLKNAYPFTDTDVRYLHSVQVDLDRTTGDVARAAGFSYISVLAGSEAHTPCGTTPWIYPIALRSKNFAFTLQPGALHPNALGETYLADSAIADIRHAFAPSSPSATPTATPRPSRSPTLLPWYLSLALIILVLVAAAIVLVRRRRGRGHGR